MHGSPVDYDPLGLQDLVHEVVTDGALAQAIASLLLEKDPRDAALGDPALGDEYTERLALLSAYQQLQRAGSQALHVHSLLGMPPLLSSRFADVAVSALLRESYLDVQTAVHMLSRGFDVQAAVILRHLWELQMRALVVAAYPDAGEEWQRAVFTALGEASGRRLERVQERVATRALGPSEMIRRTARLEARVEGEDDRPDSEDVEQRIRRMQRVYYGFLSDLAHGGVHMLAKSTLRVDETTTPLDPLAEIGTPTDWCSDLLSHTLWLQVRFWRLLLPNTPEPDREDLTPVDRTALRGAAALDSIVASYFTRLLWSGIDWADEEEDADDEEPTSPAKN